MNNGSTLQAQQIATLKAIGPLPDGTRVFINRQVIVLTLSSSHDASGIPPPPPTEDIDAAIDQLTAMKKIGQNLGLQNQQTATVDMFGAQL